MAERDFELEGWRNDWQALAGREKLARSLSERVQKDSRRLRRELLLELATAVASTGLCLWLLVQSRGKPVVAVACAGVLLFTGAWVTRLLTLRQGSSRAEATGLDAFIELTRRRLSGDIAWHRFRRRSLNVAAVLLVPWLGWALFHRHTLYRAEPWLAVVELGLLIGILAALFVHLPRKLRALEAARQRFETLIADPTHGQGAP